jgi:hypothetical protein
MKTLFTNAIDVLLKSCQKSYERRRKITRTHSSFSNEQQYRQGHVHRGKSPVSEISVINYLLVVNIRYFYKFSRVITSKKHNKYCKNMEKTNIAAIRRKCKDLDVSVEKIARGHGVRVVTSFNCEAFTNDPKLLTENDVVINNHTGRLWYYDACLRPLDANGEEISIYIKMTDASLREYKKIAIVPAWPNPLPDFPAIVKRLQEKKLYFYLI